MYGRVPPHNLEAEMAVLGSMMLGDRGAVERATEILGREDFYREAHGHIFEGMVALSEKDEPIDIITLKDELQRMGALEAIGGVAYLMQLAEIEFTTANIGYYARIVQEKAVLRRLIDASASIAGLAYGEVEEVSELVDRAERTIFEVARRRDSQGFTPLRPLLNEAFEKIDTLYHDRGITTGVDTGYLDLNYMTSGLQDGDLIILAARPSMGKCCRWDTLIDNPLTGERLTIAEYVRQEIPLVAGINACGQVALGRISHWIDSGVKPCWRVTTETGRWVEVTGHHPFLTENGWTPLYNLAPGDLIAIPRRLPIFGTDNSPLPEPPEPVGELSHLEAFPACAWTWTETRLAEFLQALLDRESHGFTTPFESLARDIQHALLRLGIIGKLQPEQGKWRVEIIEPDQDSGVGDLYWDGIVSIDPVGEHPVYDLTVPEGANFIAQDIVVHNTSLALGIGQNASLRAAKSVAVFSLEMSKEQLVQRMICSEARVDAHRMRTGFLHDEDWDRISAAVQRLWEANLFIDDSTDLSALEMRAKCRRLRAESGLDLVVVDYLQLMRGSSRSDNRNEEITSIARGLKSLARELRVPVIALSQLSRAVERREDKRPMLSDLRESGSIEAEADLVMFIYRPAYYERKQMVSQEEDDKKEEAASSGGEYDGGEEAEVIVAKHRNGPVGTVKLAFMPKYARFDNLAEHREDNPF